MKWFCKLFGHKYWGDLPNSTLCLRCGFIREPAVTAGKAPVRKVLSRGRCDDGELVVLECGHSILLNRHYLAEFPCDECAEEKPEKEK